MDDRKTIRAWAVYDWANSAYVLTVATAVLPAYFAKAVVPEGGVTLFGALVPASVLWSLTVSAAAIVVFLAAPVLGAAADLSGAKRRFLRAFCFAGATLAFCLGWSGPGDVWRTMALFAGAQVCFACGNVFYDSFLPEIASRRQLDRVSGTGFAYGYIGGGLHFVAALALIALHGKLGISQGLASRLAMASAAVWWAGFSLYTFAHLHDVGPPSSLPLSSALDQGLGRARSSLAELLRGGSISAFLLAFLFYNDGIQTVIAMATIYGTEELGLSMNVLMGTLVLIQAVAFVGAEVFSRLAERLGTRPALYAALVIWTGIVGYAYFIHSATGYVVLGALVGLVLGGSQALSRSLYAALIPAQRSAQYFGYFSVITKLSAIGGPLVFAAIRQTTGSSRAAIVAIAAFFLLGMILLSRVRMAGTATGSGGEEGV